MGMAGFASATLTFVPAAVAAVVAAVLVAVAPAAEQGATVSPRAVVSDLASPVGLAAPRNEPLTARVRARYNTGIVVPPGSTIGVPGIPRDGALPPSQAFAVAPTSANSPSWTAPAAFRPST